MRNNKVLFLVEAAIFSALAILLDVLPFLSFKLWAQGGSVSFAMVPVFIMAFRWGIKGGITTGLLLGFYQLLLGAYIVTPVQTFLDYIVAFGVIGLSGIFAQQVWKAAAARENKQIVGWIVAGVFIGSALRFISHFVAGIAFYGSLAPEGTPVWLYSLTYNGGYMLPTFILCSIILGLLFVQRPALLTHKAA
ncbi:energy-coupled thiamine transporter ThiT [Halobacillus sp. A5]|uniref:energy-coupled thiamine transporter ThiT n=1 Tax=Halobacillus sp. A5 TaxID=2880263 RepID=UPI0020A62734|nr:energy-coupled thiamine transporter ThiT [Halobacillus sp. A5]MCP3026343.1 energy-coupled thiamine transporter ThiT [Halobacillus sp. A5]